MKHFVLNDIDPSKAKRIDLFLKEMNDLAILISVAEAPTLLAEDVTYSDDRSTCHLNKSAGYFEAAFKAQLENDEILKSHFELFEDGKTIASIHHSVQPDKPIDLRVKLNCEGEDLARSELSDNFERDFSFEAHEMMGKSLEEILPATVSEEDLKTESQLTEMERDQPESDQHAAPEEYSEEQIEEENLVEEIHDLSDRIQESILNAQQLLQDLSDLCYDLTRGQTVHFKMENLNEEVLENGARIQFLDIENLPYQITYRKGYLEGTTEISFFLEKEGQLIFSLYFSSGGKGKITIGNPENDRLIQQIKERLL